MILLPCSSFILLGLSTCRIQSAVCACAYLDSSSGCKNGRNVTSLMLDPLFGRGAIGLRGGSSYVRFIRPLVLGVQDIRIWVVTRVDILHIQQTTRFIAGDGKY